MEFVIRGLNHADGMLTVMQPAVVLAGFAGRDVAAAHRHIAELARHGVSAPTSVPVFYRAPWHLLTPPDDHLEVLSATTSGEVEPVVIVADEGTFVTVGSDHTDRAAERTSIELSKQLGPKVIAPVVWPLEDVLPHWDSLQLEALIDGDTVYQRGTLAELLPPASLPIPALRAMAPGRPLVLFMGTLATSSGDLVYTSSFHAKLHDPVTHRTIALSYRVTPLHPAE